MATRPHARKTSGAYFMPEKKQSTGKSPVTKPYKQSKEMILALQKSNKAQKSFGGM